MWHLVVQRLYYAYELWKFNSFWIEGLKGWSIRHKWNLLTTKFSHFYWIYDGECCFFCLILFYYVSSTSKYVYAYRKYELLTFNNLGTCIYQNYFIRFCIHRVDVGLMKLTNYQFYGYIYHPYHCRFRFAFVRKVYNKWRIFLPSDFWIMIMFKS